VVAGFARHWPAVRWSIDTTSTPWREAAVLQLDCRKVRSRIGWRPAWNVATALERTARWYRRQHESGEIDSRADIDRYVADARAVGLAWAVPARGAQAA
jgi:CDP-glucose 4,6-dehydratase